MGRVSDSVSLCVCMYVGVCLQVCVVTNQMFAKVQFIEYTTRRLVHQPWDTDICDAITVGAISVKRLQRQKA